MEVKPSPSELGYQVVDIIDRAELGIHDCLAPFASCCAVVRPDVSAVSYREICGSEGWGVNAVPYDSYGRWFDEALVDINLVGRKYWTIERSYPVTRASRPALLGLGRGLVVTRNPMNAVQLAKTVIAAGDRSSPFYWGQYSRCRSVWLGINNHLCRFEANDPDELAA